MNKWDWKIIGVIIALVANVLWVGFSYGQVIERINTLQGQRSEFERRIEDRLQRIENLFITRPGGQ